jgi:Ran GTPase-activating protein (RanGAP) involved in mRNA processing and transport
MNDSTISEIVESLERNDENFVDLKLRDRGLTNRMFCTISEALETNFHVKSLDLRGNRLSDSSISALCSVLNSHSNAHHIRHVWLSRNRIGDDGVVELAESMRKSKLETLDLMENVFGERGVLALGEAIRDAGAECSLIELWLDEFYTKRALDFFVEIMEQNGSINTIGCSKSIWHWFAFNLPTQANRKK